MSVGVILSSWRNSRTHLYSIHASKSDTVLSECPCAANCHTATKCNRIVVVRLNFYCLLSYHHHSPLMLWANKIKWEALLSEQRLYESSVARFFCKYTVCVREIGSCKSKAGISYLTVAVCN